MPKKEMMFFGTIAKDRLSANWVASYLRDVTPNDDLEVYCHCEGGYVTEGIAIYNLFKDVKAKSKTFVIVGACQSMATVVSLAFEKVLISPLANYMLHKVAGVVEGNADNLIEVAENFKKLDEMLLAAFSKKTGKSIDDLLKNYFAKDTYLTPQQAVAEGFCDGIYEVEMDVMPQNFATLDFESKLNTLSKVFEKAQNMGNKIEPKTNTTTMFKPETLKTILIGTVMSATEYDAFEALYAKDENKAMAYLKEKQDAFAAAKTVTTTATATPTPQTPATTTPEPVMTAAQWEKEVLAKSTTFAKMFATQTDGTGSANPLNKPKDKWTYKEWEDNDPQGLAKMLSDNPDKVYELAKADAEANSPFKKKLW